MADSPAAIVNLAFLHIGDTAGLVGDLEGDTLEAATAKLLYEETRDELLGEFRWKWATRRAYPAQYGGAAWNRLTTYDAGQMVSFAPSAANVVNMPETVSSFVYVSRGQVADGSGNLLNNAGQQPDISPAYWSQLSRAAYAYVYPYPGDVIELRGIYRYTRNPREDQKVPYTIEDDPIVGTVILTDTGLPGLQDWNGSARSIELVYTGRIIDVKQFPAQFTRALSWALAVKFATSIRKDFDLAEKAQKMAERMLAIARAAGLREVQADQAPMPSYIAARLSRGRGRR